MLPGSTEPLAESGQPLPAPAPAGQELQNSQEHKQAQDDNTCEPAKDQQEHQQHQHMEVEDDNNMSRNEDQLNPEQQQTVRDDNKKLDEELSEHGSALAPVDCACAQDGQALAAAAQDVPASNDGLQASVLSYQASCVCPPCMFACPEAVSACVFCHVHLSAGSTQPAGAVQQKCGGGRRG